MTKKISLIIIMLTILSLIMPLNATPAASTVVQIAPQISIVIQGATFTVKVAITNVTDLAVWNFILVYLNTVLSCTGATKGPFLEKDGIGQYFTYTINNAYNATHGFISLGAARFGNATGVNGSGTLATITFQAKAAGYSPLVFSNNPTGSFLQDSTPPPRNLIPYTTIYGTVQIIPMRISGSAREYCK